MLCNVTADCWGSTMTSQSRFFEVSLGLKIRENEDINILILFIVTIFINMTETVKLTSRGRSDAAFEKALFPS